jgi:hypothetical protein
VLAMAGSAEPAAVGRVIRVEACIH